MEKVNFLVLSLAAILPSNAFRRCSGRTWWTIGRQEKSDEAAKQRRMILEKGVRCEGILRGAGFTSQTAA